MRLSKENCDEKPCHLQLQDLCLQEEFAGVVARAVVEPSRDMESLPLTPLGDSCGGGSRRLSLGVRTAGGGSSLSRPGGVV
jgi:hypothetical protein